jgi:hypothetical protein
MPAVTAAADETDAGQVPDEVPWGYRHTPGGREPAETVQV